MWRLRDLRILLPFFLHYHFVFLLVFGEVLGILLVIGLIIFPTVVFLEELGVVVYCWRQFCWKNSIFLLAKLSVKFLYLNRIVKEPCDI